MGSIYVICSRQCPNGDGIYTLLYALYKYSTSITNQPTTKLPYDSPTASLIDTPINRPAPEWTRQGTRPAPDRHVAGHFAMTVHQISKVGAVEYVIKLAVGIGIAMLPYGLKNPRQPSGFLFNMTLSFKTISRSQLKENA